MTHRDELLALNARVDALEQELDEAKSENELLRAAHARKSREVETLRRHFDAFAEAKRGTTDRTRPQGASAMGGEAAQAPPDAPPSPHPHARQPDVGRSLRFAVLAAGLALLGTMGMSATMSAHARQRGPAYATQASSVSPLLRVGTVVEASGPEIVSLGEQCTVERIPVASGPFDCRIEVRCGEQTLYGADPRSGFVRCEGRELVVDPDTRAFDGDPAMTLDLAHGTVTVEERVGLGTQRVRIRL